MEHLSRRQLKDRRFKWDKKFTHRQTKSYLTEDFSVPQKPSQTPIEAFLNDRRQQLDPPQYNCPALKAYLEQAPEADLFSEDDSSLISLHHVRYHGIALVDDRTDTTGWKIVDEHHAARDWDGYSDYPPAGDNIDTTILNATDLYRKLLASVGIIIIHHIMPLTYFLTLQRLSPRAVERRVV